MKRSLIVAGVLLPGLLAGQSAVVLHYWNMDTLNSDTSTTPVDVAGGLVTTAGGNMVLESQSYVSSPAGGNYLLTDRENGGIPLQAATLENGNPVGLNFGVENFSVSFWVYNDTDADTDGDVRKVRVFDSLNGIDVGIQLGSNLEGTFNFRIDDDFGSEVISNQQPSPFDSLSHPDDQWVLVVLNVDRDAEEVEVFFDGVSVGTYEISLLLGNIVAGQDLQIGCINGGAGASGIQTGGIDDLAFYSGLLTPNQISALVAGGIPTEIAPQGDAVAGHYWEFDTLNGFVPVDVYGGLTTFESGIPSIGSDAGYGIPYDGAGSGLLTLGGFPDHIVADTFGDAGPLALDFGGGSFAISYWSHAPASGTYGPAVFDFMADGGSGVEVGTTEFGIYQLRVADDAGNQVATNEFVAIDQVIQPEDEWVHVVINVDRSQDQLGVYFDGVLVPGSPFDLSALTGNIACSQDLQLGVRNGGLKTGDSQSAGLDDFAIYPGTLSDEQILGLAENTTDPIEVLDSFIVIPTPELQIVSFDRDDSTGELTIVFGTAPGQSYSVYGGDDLSDPESWPLLGTGGIEGTGGDVSVTFLPDGDPSRLFIQVRRD